MPPCRSIVRAASSKNRDISARSASGSSDPRQLREPDHVAEQHRDRLARLDRGVRYERSAAGIAELGAVGVEGAAVCAHRCGRRPTRPGEGLERRGCRLDDRRRGKVERGVLEQDLLLELLQHLAGVEAELVAQRGARSLHHRQRVCLSAGAVEREDREAGEALAQRVITHEPFELADDLCVPAEREVGLQPQLERGQAQLLQPPDLVARERLVLELRKRRPAPEPEGFAQQLAGRCGVTLPESFASPTQQSLEPLQVERARLDPQQVPSRPRLERTRIEQLAQLRDLNLHRLDRGGRRPLTP